MAPNLPSHDLIFLVAFIDALLLKQQNCKNSLTGCISERKSAMTTIVDIQKAKTQLPQLLSLALKGNEIVITEHDKPRAKIVPIDAIAGIRTAGLHKGKIKTSRDFDAPLLDSFWTGTACKLSLLSLNMCWRFKVSLLTIKTRSIAFS